jgi:hypothetical protein
MARNTPPPTDALNVHGNEVRRDPNQRPRAMNGIKIV